MEDEVFVNNMGTRQVDGVKRRKTDEQINDLISKFADKLILAIEDRNHLDPGWQKNSKEDA